jgi:hypothetical protein
MVRPRPRAVLWCALPAVMAACANGPGELAARPPAANPSPAPSAAPVFDCGTLVAPRTDTRRAERMFRSANLCIANALREAHPARFRYVSQGGSRVTYVVIGRGRLEVVGPPGHRKQCVGAVDIYQQGSCSREIGGMGARMG